MSERSMARSHMTSWAASKWRTAACSATNRPSPSSSSAVLACTRSERPNRQGAASSESALLTNEQDEARLRSGSSGERAEPAEDAPDEELDSEARFSKPLRCVSLLKSRPRRWAGGEGWKDSRLLLLFRRS